MGGEYTDSIEFDMMKTFSDAVLVMNQDGRVLARNDIASSLLQSDGIADKLRDILETIAADPDESARSCVHSLTLEDGSKICFSAHALHFSGEEPSTWAICVHPHGQSKSALNEVKSLWAMSLDAKAILDSSFDGVYITDQSGMTLDLNPAYERITGLSREALVGRNVTDLVSEGLLPNCITPLVVERKSPVTVTQTYQNGRTCHITGSPVFDEEGNVVRVVTNVRDISELQCLREELEESRLRNTAYQSRLNELQAKMAQLNGLIARSIEMQRVLDLGWTVSQVDSTVLIHGESGVGKELIARAIHSWSPRAKAPFVKINCGGIPDTLLESELFGYESGAFTGARKKGKMGLLEVGNGGTVLLDEIAELPQSLQVKLLQVLQDYQFRRVGGTKLIDIDARVIAATNKNLQVEVASGRFREDLFYRLNVVPIEVPPLRMRRDDVPPLVYHYIKTFCDKYGIEKHVSSEALHHLIYYDWPGNARELRNLMERLVVTMPGKVILANDLPEHVRKGNRENGLESEIVVNGILPLKLAVEQVERELIAKAFEKAPSTYKAAKLLGVSQPTMFRKAKKYKISTDSSGDEEDDESS